MSRIPHEFIRSLDSIQFPASKYEVVMKAEAIGADNSLVNRLLGLPSDVYSCRIHLDRELTHIGLAPARHAAHTVSG